MALEKLVPVAIERTELPIGFRRLHTVQLQAWNGSPLVPAFQELIKHVEKKAVPPMAISPLHAMSTVREPTDIPQRTDIDEILRLLVDGALETVANRLGVHPPLPRIFPEEREAALHAVQAMSSARRFSTDTEFDQLLKKLVDLEKAAGGIDFTNSLHDLVLQGHHDIARRLIELFVSHR